MPKRALRTFVKQARSVCQSALLSYPRKVQCNICGWQGRHFLSDAWHSHINCPSCRSGIRQRLFFAALDIIESLSFDRLIKNKSVLHFAPEDIVSLKIRKKSARYITADYFRQDCDLKVDMSKMPEIKNATFDTVIAFDVLEHVPDYREALAEVHRVLSPKGFAIFTVPQQDNLSVTYEDATITTPEERTKKFGQYDHLRIFGDDFPSTIAKEGFDVTSISEASFPEEIQKKYVLFPPVLSTHPLATNYRKVFFCEVG